MEFKEAFLEIKKDKPLHYFFSGQGSPVVFLHGAADSPKTFLPQAEKLAETHLCLLPYLPGHGKSYALGPETKLTAVTDSLLSLIRSLKLKRVALVGLSFGAAIAVDLCLRQPELVSRLAIIDGLVIKHRLPFTRVIPKIVADYLSDTVAAVKKGVSVKTLTAEELSAHLTAHPHIHRLAAAVDFETKLPAIKIPTLILWGAADHVIPVGHAYKIHQGIKDAQLKIFPGGHTWKRFQPEEMTQALKQFLD